MKYCDKCKVRVLGAQVQCPLCQMNLSIIEDTNSDYFSSDEELECIEAAEITKGEEIFPYIPTIYKEHHMVFKVMTFLSVALVVISVALNLLISQEHWWSLFVIAGVGCFWLTFYVAFAKRKNIPKNVLYQVLLISLIVVLWDYLTGWRGWSVDYVIPLLCFSDLLVLYILSKILYSDVDDYMIYMLIGGVFGVVPILFYLFGWLKFVLPSIVCVASSILFFAGVVIFQGDKIKEELRRRLHY